MTEELVKIEQGTLIFRAICGKALEAADNNGFSDPYLKVTIDGKTQKTKVINKTLNPVWNETLSFQLDNITQGTKVKIECWDKDVMSKDDYLGECYIFLGGLVEGEERVVEAILDNAMTGSIMYGLTANFSLPKFDEIVSLPQAPKKLIIEVLQGRDLIAADMNGKSDPYAVIMESQLKTHKTKVIQKTLTPVWNETFEIEVSEVSQKVFIPIMVFDKDFIGRDDFLGFALVPIAGLCAGDSVTGWYKLHNVKKGEIEIRLTASFDLPALHPVLKNELINIIVDKCKSSMKVISKKKFFPKKNQKQNSVNDLSASNNNLDDSSENPLYSSSEMSPMTIQHTQSTNDLSSKKKTKKAKVSKRSRSYRSARMGRDGESWKKFKNGLKKVGLAIGAFFLIVGSVLYDVCSIIVLIPLAIL